MLSLINNNSNIIVHREYYTLTWHNQTLICFNQSLDKQYYMNYSRTTAPQSNAIPRQQSINDNDSLLDESNNFDLQNQIFELTSRCNNFEYQKNKLIMSYENALKQFRQKYTILQKVCQEKQDKQENLKNRIDELDAQCAYLAQQNEGLKKQLYSFLEKNRTTPDFSSTQFAQQINIFNELVKKEERIQQLDKELQEAKEHQYRDLRDKITALEKDNKKLKEQNLYLQSQGKRIDRSSTQQDQAIIKLKDTTIQQLRKEQFNLNIQIEELKRHRASIKAQDSFQQRQKQERIAELEQKLISVDRQRARMQREKAQMQQQNKRLQNQRKQFQKAKKAYQQQAQILTNQLSQVRASSFKDKIENKKQINSIKLQIQEEKTKLRNLNEEKMQENKKLREDVLLLNDQNQQLRDRQAVQAKQIERLGQQNISLQAQNERYLRDSKKWEIFAEQSRKVQKNNGQCKKITDLQQKLDSASRELSQKSARIRQMSSQLQSCKEKLQNREEIIQIMKIQKTQNEQKLKQQGKRIKQLQEGKEQKQKVICQLQGEIKSLKEDIRHLQLAKQQTQQKLQTLKTINADIQNIKKQLQLQKNYYQQMRSQEEELRRRHKKSQDFKHKRQQSKDTFHNQKEQLCRQIQALKINSQKLQFKLSQAQNEINKKGIDISVKQEYIRKLKQNINNPKEINFQPLIETSKRNQFNAVFLENKILLLEKEITGLKNIKQKEYQEYKKVYRKNVQQKYLGEIKKSASYINELQKNIQLLNHKIHHEKETNQQLSRQLQTLAKDNYQLKYEYSQTLQELNSLLQKYKLLQTHSKDIEFDRPQTKKILEENANLKGYLDKIHRTHEQKLMRLSNANQQIQKLNETLMKKQTEIRSLKSKSPNSSFVASQQGQQKSVGNLNPRFFTEQQAQSDGDSLRSWIKKSPNFSRV